MAFILGVIMAANGLIQRTKIDASVLYKQLEDRGLKSTVKICCGKTKKRKDFVNIMNTLGYKGNYIVTTNNNEIVGIVDIAR